MKISQRYEILVVSAEAVRDPSSLLPRMEWLATHYAELFAMRFVCYRGVKTLNPDVYLASCEESFDRFEGLGVLFSDAYNVDNDWPCRINDWKHAADYLMDIALCLDIL